MSRFEEIEAHLNYLDANTLPDRKYEWEEIAAMRAVIDAAGELINNDCGRISSAQAMANLFSAYEAYQQFLIQKERNK